MARKLGKRTDQRMHMLRNQVSELLWYGRIETTEDRAKEVKRLAEKMVTLGIKNYEDVVTTTKTKTNAKGESVAVEIKNDGKRKLHARRQMMSFLRDLQEIKGEKESKSAYKERTREIKHPLIEKMFNEYAPKYAARKEELGQGGGYTRIIKLGARRGDAAEMVIIEMV
ncbi:MAG TPA: 50S ribosomal protein L17 [Clostridia bacterium]|nr:50S ribosomal protein L17 [Clostridia bacterium]